MAESMTRFRERLIDLAATALLLSFAWIFSAATPALAGAVTMASIQFWLTKNATRHEEGQSG